MEVKGFFLYQDRHTTQQVSNIKDFFEFLLKEENFDTIIELGTSLGGLTYIISDICDENNLKKNIHTLDYSYRDYVEDELKSRNVNYYILNEKEEEYKKVVTDLISSQGKCLVLCDGGNKIEEFNLYSRYLRSGDIIMAHDYSYDEKTFQEEIKDKIWNWFEISYADIALSVEENNLEPYSKLDFKNAVWNCYQKK